MRINKLPFYWNPEPSLTITYITPWCECGIYTNGLPSTSSCLPVCKPKNDSDPTFVTLDDEWTEKIEAMADDLQVHPFAVIKMIIKDWLDKKNKKSK